MSQQALKELDAIIAGALRNAGLTDRLTFGSITIEGYFERRWIEQGADDQRIGGYVQTFDCREEDVPADLRQNDDVTVEGEDGTFFYQRRASAGTGRVVLYLGTKL
jgi:hypothetical protein